METVQKEIENNIAFLRLNRPSVYNSFNREMALELQRELEFCKNSKLVRAIVITGSGKAFCAGQDLKEITDAELNLGVKKILEQHYNPIIRLLRGIKKPIIAAVNGVAAGAGANIALACDIVVACEDAIFIQAFSKIGLVPDSAGTFFLPRLIGFQKAIAIAMLGDKISAQEAERLGMIYMSVSADSFESTIQSLALKLAKMPTKTLGMTKKLFNKSLNNTLEKQLSLESKYQIKASNSNDSTEGIAAFIEKRQPNFKGSP